MRVLIVIFVIFLIPTAGIGQLSVTVPDPVIKGMAAEVSAGNLEAIVKKLVSFHTRHTVE